MPVRVKRVKTIEVGRVFGVASSNNHLYWHLPYNYHAWSDTYIGYRKDGDKGCTKNIAKQSGWKCAPDETASYIKIGSNKQLVNKKVNISHNLSSITVININNRFMKLLFSVPSTLLALDQNLTEDSLFNAILAQGNIANAMDNIHNVDGSKTYNANLLDTNKSLYLPIYPLVKDQGGPVGDLTNLSGQTLSFNNVNITVTVE